MATFLFVHGAFHGGWCFDQLRPLLAAEGHHVITPTLSGLGERRHLAQLGSINLETHITDIVNIIEWSNLDEVVLCGHSSGGMVITGVADRVPDRISTLCYFDAQLPENGDSAISLFPAILPSIAASSGPLGGAMAAPVPSAAFGVGAEHQSWVDSRLTPTPLACFTQQISLSGAYKSVRERVLVYNQTPIAIPMPIREWYAPFRNVSGYHVYGIEGGHDFMITNPSGLADILFKHAR